MFSSNQLKAVFLSAAILASACGFWRGKTDVNASPTPFVAEEIKSEIPFATKEPEIYTAEIVVTANGAQDSTFAARDAENQLLIFNYRTASEFAKLRRGANQAFVVSAPKKICAELASTSSEETTSDEFFTAEWLNQKNDVTFELLGKENNLARYRVNFPNAQNSEIVVSVDETFNLPVKQEFYDTKDGQRILILTTELRNFSQSADAKLFEPPNDCRKVSAKEFYEQRRAVAK